ncbi:hypothetical protein BpHYR1_020439 [Brachionus plicatilis]|uniref:Uncharacterized protein n=1 Tax=Brachionus plicatilis TaxID=10195 RepID=A0A3M7P7Z5_BRAPC|nr:hypothetical protein BpHYR1_020439 [Brachionus plicatilis]
MTIMRKYLTRKKTDNGKLSTKNIPFMPRTDFTEHCKKRDVCSQYGSTNVSVLAYLFAASAYGYVCQNIIFGIERPWLKVVAQIEKINIHKPVQCHHSLYYWRYLTY